MKTAFLSVLLFFGSFATQAGIDFIDIEDFNTWEKMLPLAKAQNRNLFVHVVTEDCEDCQELRKTTFKNKEVNSQIDQNFLAIKVFSYTETGKALTNLFGIDEPSTLLVLTTEEVLFYKAEGVISASELSAELKNLLPKMAAYPSWQRGAAKGDLRKAEWVNFLLIEKLNGRVTPILPIVKSVSSMLDSADFATPDVQTFVAELAIDIDNPIFQTLKRKPNWIANSANFSWQNYFQAVFNFNIARAIAQKDSVFLEDVLYQLKQLPTDSNLKNIDLKGRQLYLAELNKWTAYDTITRTYLRTFPADSANVYQREAMYLMENYTTSRPQEIALDYLRLGLRQRETFELYYTLGLYLYNANDLMNAYKSTQRAYEMAEDDEQKLIAKRLLFLIESYY